MSARAQRRSLTMPDIRLQPIPALTYLRRPSFFAGGVHIRLLGDNLATEDQIRQKHKYS